MSESVTVIFEFPDEETRSRWLAGVFDLYGSYGRAIWVDEELKLHPIYGVDGADGEDDDFA